MTSETPSPTATCRPLIENSSFTFDGTSSTLHYAATAFHERTTRLSRAFVIQREFDGVQDHTSLVPDGFELRLVTDIGAGGSILAIRDDCTILIQWFGKGVHYVTVSANRSDKAEHWIAVLRSEHPVDVEPNRFEVRTWRVSNFGSPEATTSKIDAPTWEEISRNYSTITRAALDSLAALDDPVGGPRLILWYGEPGTGKTSAIRALAREWSEWCQLHILAEPEALVTQPRYLDAAITTERTKRAATGSAGRNPHQRLLVMEDCDAVLGGRRDDVGPALSRLLNSTDGLSEHGKQTLVLITTNSPVHELHPALTRPGRCRAIVEFTPLTESEANQWLPDNTEPVTGQRTLAELFVAAGFIDQVTTEQQPLRRIGFV